MDNRRVPRSEPGPAPSFPLKREFVVWFGWMDRWKESVAAGLQTFFWSESLRRLMSPFLDRH